MTEETARREKQTVEPAASGIAKRGWAAVRALLQRGDGRKSLEKAPPGAEERYRDLVGNINDVIFEIDARGRITYISHAIEAATGHSPSDIIGHSFTEFLHPDDLPSAVGKAQKRLSGNREPSECRLLTKAGDVRWVRSLGHPILEGDRVVGFRGILTDITERKRAEKALRESEEKYRDLVEEINDIIYEVDAGGCIAYISPIVTEIAGYSPSELIGRSFTDVIHPDDILYAVEDFQRGLAGSREPSEYRMLLKSGEARWVRDWGRPIFEGDRVVGFRGVLTDITERKRAEEALRESEERYRQLVEASPYGIAVHSEAAVLYANAAAASLLGASSPDDLIGKKMWDFIHPDDREAAKARIERSRRKEGEVDFVKQKLVRVDGQVIDTESVAFSIAFQGKPARQVIVTDITERKRAEEALRDSEERYRNLVETARDVIYTVSRDGTLLSLNPAFETLTGWSRAEWLGKPFAGMIHPDDLPLGVENFRRILRGEVPPVSQLRMLTKSGEYGFGEFAARPLIADGQVVGSFGIVRDITKRKRAEEALRESEERFRSAFEDAATGMALVALDGRLLKVNGVCCEALGYSEQELMSMTTADISLPDDLAVGQDYVDRVLAGEMESYQIEKRYIDKHGQVIWGRLASSLVRDAGGNPLYFVSQIENITKRKQAEEALRESEQKYRELVENINETIYEVDATGRITYISPVAEEASEYRLSQIPGRPFAEFIHPDDLARAAERVQNWLRGDAEPLEFRLLSTSGEVRWHRSHGRPIVKEGRVVGVRGVLMDITERKRAEEALRESEERYRELVEDINDIIYEVNAGGDLTYVSPVVTEVGGYSPSEMIGRPFTDFLHPDDMSPAMESHRRGIAGNPQPEELRFLSKSGEVHWIRTFGRSIREGDHIIGFRGVLTDITERKRAEEGLQAAREELEARVERQMLRRNPYRLTFRELTVLNLVAAGRSDKEIATELGISPLTAQKHVSNILGKMEATCRTEVGVRAVREGLLDQGRSRPADR